MHITWRAGSANLVSDVEAEVLPAVEPPSSRGRALLHRRDGTDSRGRRIEPGEEQGTVLRNAQGLEDRRVAVDEAGEEVRGGGGGGRGGFRRRRRGC